MPCHRISPSSLGAVSAKTGKPPLPFVKRLSKEERQREMYAARERDHPEEGQLATIEQFEIKVEGLTVKPEPLPAGRPRQPPSKKRPRQPPSKKKKKKKKKKRLSKEERKEERQREMHAARERDHPEEGQLATIAAFTIKVEGVTIKPEPQLPAGRPRQPPSKKRPPTLTLLQ